ncbi:hypothetical protein DRQ25_18295 [Candidatus Fermentibacteria bacterium]|nr:MAG: hypothetical protein DRQ25_18295 [Candidatus Fermentibacteria bacterium]
MTSWTNNITDLTKKALRNGGYEDDSVELIRARVIGASQQGPAKLIVLAHFGSCNARVYLELDATGNWIAEY